MDNKKTLDEFSFKFCKNLLESGATYSSIILSKANTVLYSYSTNLIWDGLYHESGYSKSCHLINATKILSKTQDGFTLFWDAVPPDNDISNYLNAKRNEKNISHGVSFCIKNKNDVLEILTIAGRACDLNFSEQVIRNRNKIYKELAIVKSNNFMVLKP